MRGHVLTTHEKIAVLNELKSNPDRRRLADKDRVSANTISRIMSNATKIQSISKPNQKGGSSMGNAKLEEALLSWFKQRSSNNRIVSRAILQAKARELASKLVEDYEPGPAWLQRWCKQNGISLSQTCKKTTKNNNLPHITANDDVSYTNETQSVELEDNDPAHDMELFVIDGIIDDQCESVLPDYDHNKNRQQEMAEHHQLEIEAVKIEQEPSNVDMTMDSVGQPIRNSCERAANSKSCSNCSHTVKLMERRMDDLKQTMQRENKAILDQFNIVMETLAEQKELLNQLLWQRSEEHPIQSMFPLKTEEDLQSIDAQIDRNIMEPYVNTMKMILAPDGVRKRLRYILSDHIIMNYNVHGIQKKKALKSLPNFYAALLASIPTSPSGTPEEQLREAIQLCKKRIFKNLCVLKKSAGTHPKM